MTMVESVITSKGGLVTLELIHIVVDFITLGVVSLFLAVTISLWWGFVDSFVFEQGYLGFINRHPVLKCVFVIASGILLLGFAIINIHKLLWG